MLPVSPISTYTPLFGAFVPVGIDAAVPRHFLLFLLCSMRLYAEISKPLNEIQRFFVHPVCKEELSGALLRVKPVFRLLEYRRVRTVYNLGRDLFFPMRRQAMQKCIVGFGETDE